MTAATTHNSLIHAIEVWSSNEGGKTLQRTSGCAEIHGNISQSVVERVIQGLAPVIMHVSEFDGLNGSSSSITAVVGIPIVKGRAVLACVVMAIACAGDAMGAFEIWSRDDRDELGLNGAIFAGLSRFASITEHVRFPRGSGLPGQCWEEREVKLVSGLGTSANFMRSAGARAGGLDVGVALPIMTTEHDLNSVVLLLSTTKTPIARRCEVWDIGETARLRSEVGADSTQAAEQIAGQDEESSADNATKPDTVESYSIGEGIIGSVWQTGVPLATDDIATVERKRLAFLQSRGIMSAIAMPIYVGDQLKSVFVMFN